MFENKGLHKYVERFCLKYFRKIKRFFETLLSILQINIIKKSNLAFSHV